MTRTGRPLAALLALAFAAACSPAPAAPRQAVHALVRSPSASPPGSAARGLPGMPALLDPRDVYAADRPGLLSPA
ncbi:MAG: hypothetical protein QOJ50_550, partial [Cryptosporangiaceae bacterium]|nr:hypothetical protein [Cryptosporangiaceae bacterium]